MSQPEDRQDRSYHFAWGADVLLSQCVLCKHAVEGPQAVCAAFPGEVPDEILANDVDHRKPYTFPGEHEPGDRGVPLERSITFEPREGINPQTLAILYAHLDSLSASADGE